MSNKLNVRNFQSDLLWQSPLDNLSKIEQMLPGLEDVDLLVCPEMFTTGFSMAVQNIAETWPGETVSRLKEFARLSDTAIICSLVVKVGASYLNRLVFVHPNGKVDTYDKRHLFTMGDEDKYYQAGKERLIIEYKSWRIMPLVCYDLRFPVWSRNQDEYDLLVYVANWPESRRDVWMTLLKARAIENQAYVLGSNRVGTDGMGLKYSGDSMAFNARGEVLMECKQCVEMYADVCLDIESLREFREKFPVLRDRDIFEIRV